MELLFKNEVFEIVGAAMKVHSVLGRGFLEQVYQEALAIEFEKRGIPFQKEKQIRIIYDGVTLNKQYQADFFCYDKIIVEIKAVSDLNCIHESQILNYLKATDMRVGVLINFGEKSLVYERYVS